MEEILPSRLESGSIDGYQPLINDTPDDDDQKPQTAGLDAEEDHADGRFFRHERARNSRSDDAFESGEQTPVTNRQYTSSLSSKGSPGRKSPRPALSNDLLATPANGNIMASHANSNTDNPACESFGDEDPPHGQWNLVDRFPSSLKRGLYALSQPFSRLTTSLNQSLPPVIQKVLGNIYAGLKKFANALWRSLNPPLLAMGASLLVASIPSLQRLFFSDGTFVSNSITSAIRQNGGVAVPLILVVLGANLARSSQQEEHYQNDDSKIETRLLVASLLSRMVLPTIVLGPLLATAAKYIPVSILDDPIFVVVCFLLAGAPSALQLAQICQINEVYMGAMTKILFHSYVIWWVFALGHSWYCSDS